MQTHSTLISVADLKDALGFPHLQVVDCRFDLLDPAKGRADFLKSHIPGAAYADLDKDLAAPISINSGRHPLPGIDEFTQTLERLGISNATQVVAYDAAGGAIAARLWWMLQWLGHDKVAVLDGGFAAWTAAGLAVETRTQQPETGRFVPREKTASVLETSEIARGLRDGNPSLLVDARDEARFLGTKEPIDSIAGHIPGAINFPLTRSLGPDGHWRGTDELHAAWEALFDGEPPHGWAVMCGSGVTACHLALSAAQAGLPPPRLYAGSWSEWIRDPGRPTVPPAVN